MDWFQISLCCLGVGAVVFLGAVGVTLLLIRFYLNYTSGICKSTAKMNGKTVLITGATSGIGKVTALDIANRGARVILACRNLEAANKVKDEITESTGNKEILVYDLDLSSFASIRAFATTILENESRLDVLIHNAGYAGMWSASKSADDIEMTFATNHFGPFLLTHLLAGLLKKSAPCRVVVVASEVYKIAYFNLLNLNPKSFWPNSYLYFVSKLLNIHFSMELARRFKGTGVNVNCLHPGFIGTGIWRNVHIPFSWGLRLIDACFFKSVELGAQTSIHLAVSEELEGVTGRYFKDCQECYLWQKARDKNLAKKIWEASESMVKLTESDPKI